MITFPNCKINLGLYVTGKRVDGFHSLETVFYPVGWCDALEVTGHPAGKDFELRTTGPVTVESEGNIIFKAWRLLREREALPPVLACLYKNIPTGAGLGGGSADGSFFLKLMNERFSLGMGSAELNEMALTLGSDCPFFLQNKPVLATGRGEIFTHVDLSLDEYYILVVHPGIHISTARAFSRIVPRKPPCMLHETLLKDPGEWTGTVSNDFEKNAMEEHPELAALKKQLYDAGALYASMSGSGSSFFGIFATKPQLQLKPSYRYFVQEPAPKIL